MGCVAPDRGVNGGSHQGALEPGRRLVAPDFGEAEEEVGEAAPDKQQQGGEGAEQEWLHPKR